MSFDFKNPKTWLSIVVVAAAALIILPGLFSLLASLLRLLLIIVIAGGTCLAIAHARTRAAKLVSDRQKTPALTTDSKSNSAEANNVSQ